MNTVWAVSHISICGNYFQICCIGSTTAEPEKYFYNPSAEYIGEAAKILRDLIL